MEDRVVKGVRSGDRGRGKDGEELGNFEPGSDVVAKATVLAEGTVGHLTYAAYDYFDMHGADPMRWELGVKEVWEVKEPLDRVIHTMGWPLRKVAKYNEFGGSFIYPMGEDKICIGLVAGLDYTDATFSVHDALQLFKTHPFIKKMIEGGKRVAWGAKTIPSGGYFAMPKRLAVPGMVVAGDAASMVNIPTLKGVHYAMHAGMYAAEAIVDALKQDIDSVNFEAYDEKIHNSTIEKDLYESRNMRQPFSKGFFLGGAFASAMTVTKGNFPGGHWSQEHDAENEMEIGKAGDMYVKADNELTFNKLDSVFLSGNATRDDAPNHVRIQTRVPREIAQTWVSMCPAQVYEIPDDQLESRQRRGRRPRHRLQLRPVRRDHRQGRPPDPARGRRRAALPGDVGKKLHNRRDLRSLRAARGPTVCRCSQSARSLAMPPLEPGSWLPPLAVIAPHLRGNVLSATLEMSMSERTALIVAFTAVMAITAVSLLALGLLRASPEVRVLAYMLLLCGGAHAVSQVVVHYRS